MSIQDADCLGRCLAAQPDNPVAALRKYQEERIPQTSQEVQICAILLACPGQRCVHQVPLFGCTGYSQQAHAATHIV